MAILSKLCLGLAAAAVMGGIAAGMAWHGEPAANSNPPAGNIVALAPGTGKEPAAQHDFFNDPLPGGAVARLGTLAFRHGPVYWDRSPLKFTPDGKYLISSGGGWIRRWDVATGHAIVNLGDGWQALYTTGGADGRVFATADGKLGRICTGAVTMVANKSELVWPCRCTEYDLETGKEKRTYALESPRDTHETHWLPEYQSADGSVFVELTRSGGLTVWNAATGTFKYYLKPESEPYTALAFAPDGKTFIAGDVEHTFRVFDLDTGKELRSFDLPNGDIVVRMAISPDGRWLATAGGKRGQLQQVYPSEHDRFLRLWDLKDGSFVRAIDFPEDKGVESVIFGPDSQVVIAGLRGQESGSPAAVRIWDLAGIPAHAWVQDRAMGLYLAVSPDGKTLATMNGDGVIRLWDTHRGKETSPLPASPCGLVGVGFRPDGTTMITFGEDRVLGEWDAATGRRIALAPTKIKGSLVKMSPDGKYLVTRLRFEDRNPSALIPQRGQNDVIRLYDQVTGRLLLEHPGWEAALSRDGKRLAVRRIADPLEILDIESGKVVQTLTLPQQQEAPGRRGLGVQGDRGFGLSPNRTSAGRPLDFTPDGKSLIVFFDDQNTVSIWDLGTAKQTKSWGLIQNKIIDVSRESPGFHDTLNSIVVSPDGNQIAFAVVRRILDPDRYLQLARLVVAEAMTGKIVFQNERKPDHIGQLAFSPDGKLLASGGAMKTIHLWDAATGKEIRQFDGHLGRIKALAFSPDSKRLASASEDSTVLIWEVAK